MLHFRLHFLPDMPKLELLSQGSATIYWRYGGKL